MRYFSSTTWGIFGLLWLLGWGSSCNTLECPTGQVACGSICVDLQSDPAHCGECQVACSRGSICAGGRCAVCEDPLLPDPCVTRDSGKVRSYCANLSTDEKNCGACGLECQEGQELCSGGRCKPDLAQQGCKELCKGDAQCNPSTGKCECPSGYTSCPINDKGESDCFATDSSWKNCGQCGTTCPSQQLCLRGKCVSECSADYPDKCFGGCVHFQTDPFHCGKCGGRCPTGWVCNKGVCQCPGGRSLCDNSCVDLKANPLHCGTCQNACKPGQICVSGSCSCPKDTSLCGELCINLQHHPSHCGACGKACAKGQFCSKGSCVACLEGQKCGGVCCVGGACCKGEAGELCVDIQSHPEHCGSCGNICHSSDRCLRGVCVARQVCVETTQLKGWVRTLGGPNAMVYGRDLAVTPEGDAYVVGFIKGEASTNDGANKLVSKQVVTAYLRSPFVVKFAKDGSFAWGKVFNATGQLEAAAIDPKGGVFVTGQFRGAFSDATNGVNLTSSRRGSDDIFVLRLDASGGVVWAVQGGSDGPDRAADIAFDPVQDDLYVYGDVFDKSSFGSASVSSAKGRPYILLAKLTYGGVWTSAHAMGGADDKRAGGMAIGANSLVWLTGTFRRQIQINAAPPPNPNSKYQKYILPTRRNGVLNFFVAIFEDTGRERGFVALQGSNSKAGEAWAHDIVVDGKNRAYVVGEYTEELEFPAFSKKISTRHPSLKEQKDLFYAIFNPPTKSPSSTDPPYSLTLAELAKDPRGDAGHDSFQGLALHRGSGTLYFSGLFTNQFGLLSPPFKQQGAVPFAARYDLSNGKFNWGTQLFRWGSASKALPMSDERRIRVAASDSDLYLLGTFSQGTRFLQDPSSPLGERANCSNRFIDVFLWKQPLP